jgi:hypothetical protein
MSSVTAPSLSLISRSQLATICGSWVDVDRHLVLAAQRGQQVEDCGGAVRVQVAGRLVGEKQVRGVDQRPRDGGPLLFAAGLPRRQRRFPAAEADRLEEPTAAAGLVPAGPVGSTGAITLSSAVSAGRRL